MTSTGRTIFLVSPFVPYPPARGIELRITRLITWLHDEGHRVVLIVPAESMDAEALNELRKITYAIHWTSPALRTRLGMRFPYLRRKVWERWKRFVNRFARKAGSSAHDRLLKRTLKKSPAAAAPPPYCALGDDQIKAWFAPDKLIALVGKLARKYRPHAVIAEYIFSTPVFASLPTGTIKIVDTIDVFSRKEDQVLAFGIADPLACTEEEERRSLLLADVIVAIQSREARLLKALVPEREVLLTGIDFDVIGALTHEEEAPNSIAIVASDNALNIHGLTAFLSECWPAIKTGCPDVVLHVVGRVGEMCRSDDSSIRYSGWIDNLDQVYREASVVINPTVAGTGLKIKSVQALAYGKPLVAWTNGVEGLEYEGTPPDIECSSWQEFADAVLVLLRSESIRSALAERALTYASQEFKPSKVYATLRNCLLGAAAPTQSNAQQDERVLEAGKAIVAFH